MTLRAIATVVFMLVILGTVLADDPKDSANKTVARLIHYSGKVQDVGFRATTVEIAKDYRVNGWVMNLDDGRVELLVEGPEAEVKKFLEAVRTHWKKNIDKEQLEEKKPTGEFKRFAVRQ